MSSLRRASRPIQTVFDLIGYQENDFTAALGWTLATSPHLLDLVLRELDIAVAAETPSIRLQEYDRRFGGLTDIEIDLEKVLIILEAKVGWSLPKRQQLAKYAKRVNERGGGLILVVSECSPEFARARGLPERISGIQIEFLRWHRFVEMADAATRQSRGHERWAVREFGRYLHGQMTGPDPHSNMVRVVALNPRPVDWMSISLADVVLERGRYFHPVARPGFLREPPNYFGFRIHGRLESVRHVEEWEYCTHPHDHLPEIDPDVDWTDNPHFIYRLGEAFGPSDLPTGRGLSFGRQCDVALDLLFTEETIADAWRKTKERDRLVLHPA